MKKFISWLDVNFEPLFMVAIFFLIMFLLFAQVMLRCLFESGFSWAEEVSRFAFVWLMYFSFAYAARNHRHIRMSFFSQLLGERTQKALMLLSDFLFLFFAVVIFYSIVELCISTHEYNDRAVTVDVSLNVIYAAGGIGFLLMIIRLVQGIAWKFREFNSPLERFENYGGACTGANSICFIFNKK